jgi:tetratricopeptide (TPR) repeat protein
MSSLCQNLHPYFDGELSASDEENFRHHLARCEDCGHQLHELMQLELVGQEALSAPAVAAEPAPEAPATSAKVLPLRRPAPKVMWSAGALTALAASVLAVVFVSGGAREQDVWVAQAPTRTLEARLTWPSADRYRPYVPMRGGAATEAPLSLRSLAGMEERGELLGIAAAYLLRGDTKQAEAFLGRAPSSLDRDCDRAVVAMESGNYEEALTLLDGVLQQKPDHAQALWNRGLVLREMGLTMMAAEAFDAVAKLGEPGWSEEAKERARALRQETMNRARSWKEALAASWAIISNPEARLPLAEARRYPGIVRVSFYHALHAATSREQALRLMPLADELDRLQGGSALSDSVRRVAGRDFRRRAPLARGYAQLVRFAHPSPETFLAELSRSGEDDIYLGALLWQEVAPRHIDAFVRVAKAQKDPWFDLLAERELAAHEEYQGEWWKAEARLQSAIQACRDMRLPYRCANLEKRLSDLYITTLHRPADSYEHVRSGWTLAKEMGDWDYERQFLQELAQIAILRLSLPSARAYLQESLAREPEDCVQRVYIHRNLAHVAYLGMRLDEARREIEQAAACGQSLGMSGARVLSNLSRSGVRAGDAELLGRTLEDLRRSGLPPGELALLAFIDGQFSLERDRSEGQRLLRDAIAQAERLPDDTNARKARAFAYAALIGEAGRAGAYEDALSLMAEELRVEVPRRCVLAVAVDQERTLVVARGVEGALLGHFDASRTQPLGEDVSGLVPEEMLRALGGCEHVVVLARPPVHGHTGLLPMGMAWSYHVGRELEAPTRSAAHGAHLVVTDVEVSRSLQLPRLPPLKPARVEDPARVELTGTRATPSRVLAAMAEATEIEIHAHGLISPEVSDASLIVFAPEADGRYALTASQIRKQRLAGAPVVLLATCSAARTAPFPHESFSLPVAFIEAGARAVLASTVDIPDTAGRFFESVRERIRSGARPSVALRDERQRWLEAHPDASWVRHVLLFE